MTRVGSQLFLTFFDWAVPARMLLWLDETGDILRQQSEPIGEVSYVYGIGDTAMLVEYAPRFEEEWLWHFLAVHGYAASGARLFSDTLLADTLDNGPIFEHIFVGSSFDERDGELLAALITATAVQYPQNYRAQLVRYRDNAATRHDPFETGSPPMDGYLSHFRVAHGGNGGGVLLWFSVVSAQNVGLRARAFNASGAPYSATREFPPDSAQLPYGLSVVVHDGTVYAAYAAQSGSVSSRGVYAVGFPENELLDAGVSPSALPASFHLAAYPNPFNAATRIEFTLPRPGEVSLIAYDVLGREIARLADGVSAAGTHSVLWKAENQASGLYFLRAQSGSFSQTKKVILIR